MHSSFRLVPVTLALLLFTAAATVAGDWPGWRGPTGLGYSDEQELPLKWNGKTGENIVWKTKIAGVGPKSDFASPGRSDVLKAGPKFEILAPNDLEQEGDSQDYTTAAIADGRIYSKGRYYLWCIGKK